METEVIVEEEEVEEEEDSIVEDTPKEAPKKVEENKERKVVVPPIPLNQKKSVEEVRLLLKNALASETNKYEGQQMVLKSLFDHQEADLQQMVPLFADNARLNQDKLLKQQIEALKLKPQPEMSARIDK